MSQARAYQASRTFAWECSECMAGETVIGQRARDEVTAEARDHAEAEEHVVRVVHVLVTFDAEREGKQ